ncbi:hypothetical protein KFL_004220040 [Klebsormidium nitens]|uniref:Protein N-lysine methyltransferase METTL21A n=1 Tax=Klebsormidium nitens TaxID=105231 RepID=A0A1Y1IBM7_KLENI|nr:hypothetical protein KFL_004220040 [Klebsormidium nitens]|eukprot:GAQ88365.1 hypothetical protein KFL_004220040 [Klebsormidium nitens]
MPAPSVISNSRSKKRKKPKPEAASVDGEGGATSNKLQKLNKDTAEAGGSPVNAFLRAWAWKREPLPDRYKYDLPYVHKFVSGGQEGSLTIQQKRFKETGFASTVWDSSIVLAKYLERWQEALVRGKRCIELGAGCGLVGICAARFGAGSVVLTDLPGNLSLLERNRSGNSTQDTQVSELVWGADVAHLEAPFDVVFATDVIYDGSVIHQLVATLIKLSNERTRILIAYGRNRWAEKEFMDAIQLDFDVVEVGRELLDSVYACDDVKMLSLTRLARRTPT